MHPRLVTSAAAVLCMLAIACSSGGSSTPGGPKGSGGVTAQDGSMASGGRAGTGGAIGSGGMPDQGHTTGSGGGSGGAEPGTGGAVATGGSPGSDVGGSPSGAGGAGTGGAIAGAGGRAIGSGGASGGHGGASPGAGGGSGASGAGGATPVTCPSRAKPTDGTKTVLVGAASRSYYLHIPAAYDGSKPAPLVVDFHGLGGDGTSEASSNPYRPVIDPEGVISAYPSGASGSNGTGWNLGPCCTSADDVGFARALVQDVEKMACIDPKRVYAVGYSLGGGMVHVLACQAADIFAAASPAAADLVQQNVAACKPARPITVFTFRGTADSAVPYAGGTLDGLVNIGAATTFKTWAQIDQCTGSPSAADSQGCSTYSSCAGNVRVTLCTKQGGGHDPGNAAVSWPVLKTYTLP